MTTDWNQRVIEGLVQAVVDELGLPGLAVGIVRDDATLYAAAQGVTNLELRHPVSTRTLFRLGSITKVFTATLLMTFVEAGQVNLDDAVGEYLPQFKAFDPEGKITFQHLATHTSGLPMMPPTVTFPEGIEGIQDVTFPSIDDLLDALGQTDLLFPPGSDFTYSNYGVGILGHTLAIIGQKPYRELVAERVLQPIGMTDTVFDPHTSQLDAATGYILFVNPPVIMPMVDIGGFTPAGQLFSNIEDMLKFARAQWGQSALGLSQQRLTEMQTTRWEKQQPMGIGWKTLEIGDSQCVYHGGADPGYVSYLIAEPKQRLGVVLMTNAAPSPERIEALGNDIMLELLTT